jgi:hypothetical protein
MTGQGRPVTSEGLPVIINYKGTSYTYDPESVTVKQAMMLEAHTGTSFEKWGDDISTANLKALQAFGWLILTGGDLDAPIGDTDFGIAALAEAVGVAQAAEKAAEDAKAAATPGPTAPTSAALVEGVNGLVAPSLMS